MENNLNLFLTEELREFIDANCGEGTLYATPGEFVLDLLRQAMLQTEAAKVRDAIIEGYQDAIDGRVVEFRGDLRSCLRSRGDDGG